MRVEISAIMNPVNLREVEVETFLTFVEAYILERKVQDSSSAREKFKSPNSNFLNCLNLSKIDDGLVLSNSRMPRNKLRSASKLVELRKLKITNFTLTIRDRVVDCSKSRKRNYTIEN